MIYDISLPLTPSMPVFPGDPTFHRELHAKMDRDRANTSKIALGAHAGTHVDAPLHMMAQGSDVAAFRPESLLGPVRVVEILDDKAVTLEELKSTNLSHVERILFKTRNSADLAKGKFQKDYVYLAPSAAVHLAEKKVSLVGLDSLSLERFGAASFDAHLALMARGTVILEGIDLSSVAPGDYLLFCAPLLIPGSDGAPARTFLVDGKTSAGWGRFLTGD